MFKPSQKSLLLCRRLANFSCFRLFRKCSKIFRNASLLPPSNVSSSSHCFSEYFESELRNFWCLLSSFFTKVTMLSSSSWNQITYCINYTISNIFYSTSPKNVIQKHYVIFQGLFKIKPGGESGFVVSQLDFLKIVSIQTKNKESSCV